MSSCFVDFSKFAGIWQFSTAVRTPGGRFNRSFPSQRSGEYRIAAQRQASRFRRVPRLVARRKSAPRSQEQTEDVTLVSRLLHQQELMKVDLQANGEKKFEMCRSLPTLIDTYGVYLTLSNGKPQIALGNGSPMPGDEPLPEFWKERLNTSVVNGLLGSRMCGPVHDLRPLSRWVTSIASAIASFHRKRSMSNSP